MRWHTLGKRIEKPLKQKTVGDFVEKFEHQVVEGGQRVESETLFFALREQFKQVVDSQSIHMSFISAYNN